MRVQDKTDSGLSTRDGKEADQGLDEAQNASKVSTTVTFYAGGAIDDKSQRFWDPPVTRPTLRGCLGDLFDVTAKFELHVGLPIIA